MAGLGDYFLSNILPFAVLHVYFTTLQAMESWGLGRRLLSTSKALTSESSNFHSSYCQCNSIYM